MTRNSEKNRKDPDPASNRHSHRTRQIPLGLQAKVGFVQDSLAGSCRLSNKARSRQAADPLYRQEEPDPFPSNRRPILPETPAFNRLEATCGAMLTLRRSTEL